MKRLVEIDSARERFAAAIGKQLQQPAHVETRVGPLPDDTTYHCTWSLKRTSSPDTVTCARGIIVHLSSGAMAKYRAGGSRSRAAMLKKFERMVKERLAEGYNPDDVSLLPFTIDIFELDPSDNAMAMTPRSGTDRRKIKDRRFANDPMYRWPDRRSGQERRVLRDRRMSQ